MNNQRIVDVNKYIPIKLGRLLDVSCDDGVFWSYDSSRVCKLLSKRRFKVWYNNFFEVLEHQDKPKEFLETIKRMLKPGGYIAEDVPNKKSEFVKNV